MERLHKVIEDEFAYHLRGVMEYRNQRKYMNIMKNKRVSDVHATHAMHTACHPSSIVVYGAGEPPLPLHALHRTHWEHGIVHSVLSTGIQTQ